MGVWRDMEWGRPSKSLMARSSPVALDHNGTFRCISKRSVSKHAYTPPHSWQPLPEPE